MADQTIREAERAWRASGDPAAAARYLSALERAGALPDQVPVEVPTEAPPIAVVPEGPNQVSITIPGRASVLVSYHTPVAARVDGRAVWSPGAAYSRTSRKHIRQWLGSQFDNAEEVSEEDLVDLLRLVPIAEFWAACDGCFEKRRGVERQDDGRDLCAVCVSSIAEAWGPERSHAATCTSRHGAGECDCPKSLYQEDARAEATIECSRCLADDEPVGALSCGECGERFCRACDTSPTSHPGNHRCPWEVEARDGAWYVVHATKRAKRIGPVGGPRGDGNGINYHDRAIAERQRRNHAIAANRVTG